MGTKATRTQKNIWIAIHVSEHPEGISKEQLFAEFCLLFNSTKITAREILNNYLVTNRIVEYHNLLYTQGNYQDLISKKVQELPGEK